MIEIIANPLYKRVLKKLEEVEKVLKENNITYKVYLTKKDTNADFYIKKCASKTIVVIGGDGTINRVLSNYKNDCCLVYYPSGSGNDLARSINLLKDENILDKLNKESKIYDIGSVDDKKFCVGLDAGYSAEVVKKVNNSYFKKYFKKYTYTIYGILCCLFAKKYRAKIKIDDNLIITNNLYQCSIMIHKYAGGGIEFFKNATGNNGKLNVMIARDMSKIKFIYNMLCIIFKKQKWLKGVEFFETENFIEIETNQGFYQTDGEIIKKNKKLTVNIFKNFYKIK